MTRLKRGGLLGGLSVAALVWTPAAMAQDALPQAAEDTALEDENAIVVTARKRVENLIDVPLAVSVATADQLKRDQIYNVTDLQRITPALEVAQTFGGESNGGGRLRGFGTGVFNPSVAPSVALVIDQVPIGNLNFPVLFDMAQVEVLRGPQGTLFGQGASAGVLNITTRNPEFDRFAANVSIDAADKGTAGAEFGEVIVNAGMNVPLGSNVALRVSGQFRRETGLQRSATTGLDNRIDDFGVRAKLRFEPSESLKITLTGEHGQNDSRGQTFFALAIAPNSTAPFGAPGGTRGAASTAAFLNPAGCAMPVISERAEWYCENAPTDQSTTMSAASAVVDVSLSDALSLTSVTAFRAREFLVNRRDFSRLTTAPAARQERTAENANGFSQELRLNYVGAGFDVVGGLFYTDYVFDRTPIGEPAVFGATAPADRVGFSVCTFAGTVCPVPISFTREFTNNRTMAAFADVTINLTDQVELFGGLRYDDYRNTTRVQVFRATPGPSQTLQINDGNLSGRIGLSYMPNPDVNLFASFARGYKPPAAGTDPSGALFELNPELSDSFELGAKVGIGRLQLSGNAFYTRLRDFQSQANVFVGTALVARPLNIDRIVSKGFELTAFGQITRGFSINAGYQFNDVRFPAGFVGEDGLPLGGTQLINAPKHKITLSSDYGHQVSDGLELFVNANVVYRSEILLGARADPRFRFREHAIVNGGLGVRAPDGAWTASLFVRNLTKTRAPVAYLASTFAGQPDGGLRALPAAGQTARVVGARVGFQF
ncbi:TonB-dependent receptor [Novosphingobium piscinae]|uniref:TonB-dependent receptor n=1 Tax=Novosphingobium piscinae TaxID=1507448 RepID=A0A7X1KQ40_9SPHN|nr:TonB-dependent receptor [Novosphingobium piscinae]MBC2669326.1 TonB-dependent receptor [Novosphingobium piscinae]